MGTFVFLAVIALSAPIGTLAPLAIGTTLMVMVYMGGHISGGHYNPAVSFAVFLRGKMRASDLFAYWVVQFAAGVLAFVFGYLVSGHTPGIHPGAKVSMFAALTVEATFTAVLTLVVLNVASTKATAGNSFYGLAIGFAIVGALFAGGQISGGAFNPAVGFAATFGSVVFANGGWANLWLYIAGPIVGAGIGAGVHVLQIGDTEVPPPVAEDA